MHDDLSDLTPEHLATLDRARARFEKTVPPPAGPVLSAFLDVGLTNDKGDLPATAASNANEPATAQVVGLPNWRTTSRYRRPRAMRALGAFIGTTLGKVVLGTTVAAAAVGAGQASGAIDVNRDPKPAPPVTVASTDADEVEADEVETPEVESPEVEAPEIEADDADADEVEAPDSAVDADDQGEDLEDHGEDADDQGDDLDDQSEDADDQDEIEADDEADDAEEIEADDSGSEPSGEDDGVETEAESDD